MLVLVFRAVIALDQKLSGSIFRLGKGSHGLMGMEVLSGVFLSHPLISGETGYSSELTLMKL